MLKSHYSPDLIEAGTDEAGRGCLAGPVFAAAVILPKDYKNDILKDSKKLSEAQRNQLFDTIKEDAISYSIASVSPKRIDKINILNASIEAMHKSISKLHVQPEFILVDGNRFKPFADIEFECVIKGDNKFFSIAAASVLAKVSRDRYMQKKAESFPEYDWANNKGYPTAKHRKAILNHGPCNLHRNSFRLLPEAEQLDFFRTKD